MSTAEPLLLSIKKVSKSFPGVTALDKVDLEVGRGEVLAVIGENGAGKSTLMKILAGIQPPDEGRLYVDGDSVAFSSVNDALDQGIVLIHQELNLAANLDVGANIFLGREPSKLGFIDRNAIRSGSKSVLQKIGLDVSPDELISNLPIGHQQMIEIAKALSVGARLLIMDEPTSSLSAREVESLFKVIHDLRDEGVSIIYISHRLDEVLQLADRVVVLRDGKNAGSLSGNGIERNKMVNMMVGRDVSRFYARAETEPGDAILEVKDLATPEFPQHKLNFSIRSGEIVGVSGLVGAGRTEMMLTLFGMSRAAGGEILVDGKTCNIQSPRDAIDAGIALVPEDRKQQGLMLEMNVMENIGMPGLDRHRQHGVMIDRKHESENATATINELGIKTPNMRQTSRHLSGGNQQKIVIGKWLALDPKIFLLDEPTRGIDIGSKEEVYRLIDQMAQRGVAILLVSSEMEEIIGMSDRVLVMHEGRISGELQGDAITEEAIMQLATGTSPRREKGQ